MEQIPSLWWSPSLGLYLRRKNESCYQSLLSSSESSDEREVLPADSVRLEVAGSDYIRVGEFVSTQNRSSTYILRNGPTTMYLEPVEQGAGASHDVEMALIAADGGGQGHWLTVLATEVRRLQAQLHETEGHTIEFSADGWTIMHPLACRPNLFSCEVTKAAGRVTEAPEQLGRFACWLDKDGQLVVDGRDKT